MKYYGNIVLNIEKLAVISKDFINCILIKYKNINIWVYFDCKIFLILTNFVKILTSHIKLKSCQCIFVFRYKNNLFGESF